MVVTFLIENFGKSNVDFNHVSSNIVCDNVQFGNLLEVINIFFDGNFGTYQKVQKYIS